MKQFLTALILCTTLFVSAQTVKNVDAATFHKYVQEKTGIIIDLRTNDEIASKGKIKGALQLDFLSKNAEAQIEKLDKEKTYLIYCAGGGRSGDCAELMQKTGFKQVINLEKGFGDWVRKGYEVEKK